VSQSSLRRRLNVNCHTQGSWGRPQNQST